MLNGERLACDLLGYLDESKSELPHRSLLRIADVVGPSIPTGEHEQRTHNRVGDVAETPCGEIAETVHLERLPIDGGGRELRHDSVIEFTQATSVYVEIPHRLDLHAGRIENRRQRLRTELRDVVGASAHIPRVERAEGILTHRQTPPSAVTVQFTRAREQHGGALRSREFEHVPGTLHDHVVADERALRVVHRRSDGREG